MVWFLCQKQGTMPRKQPPYKDYELELPAEQSGTPQFKIGKLSKKEMDDTFKMCLRRYTPTGVEEMLKEKTLPEHELHMQIMKTLKDAFTEHKVVLNAEVIKCRDSALNAKLTALVFAYKILSTDLGNAIKRMKGAGERRFLEGEEVTAPDTTTSTTGDVPDGVDAMCEVLGIVPHIRQPPPPALEHPEDRKRKFDEEKEYEKTLDDAALYAHLGQKLARKADLEKEYNIRKLDAAVYEQKMASQEVEQKKVQVSAAEVAFAESKGLLEEAKRLLSVANDNLKKADEFLQLQKVAIDTPKK